MYFDVTVDAYAECATIECETSCATTTPGPVEFTFEMSVAGQLPSNFDKDLSEWMKKNDSQPTLQDLIDDNFVNDSGLSDPGNAYSWFGPVSDAVDFNKYSPTTGAGGKNYLRPIGKDSFSLSEESIMLPGLELCNCARYIPNAPVTEVYSSKKGSIHTEEQPVCDTTIHFENVRVDPSEVKFYPKSQIRATILVQVTMDVVAECVMVGCETTCTTSTPSIKDMKTSFGIPSGNLTNEFLNDLENRKGKDGFSLQDLADEGYFGHPGTDPGNAYTWFRPAQEAIDYGIGFGSGGAWADDALGKEAVRPKGKKSISRNAMKAADGHLNGWDYLTGGVKPCTCMRYVTHSSSSSSSSKLTRGNDLPNFTHINQQSDDPEDVLILELPGLVYVPHYFTHTNSKFDEGI
tara:strand:- start:142 stop:1356 length:1215 start_codon:yes stop_codon:yes gene_type:complete